MDVEEIGLDSRRQEPMSGVAHPAPDPAAPAFGSNHNRVATLSEEGLPGEPDGLRGEIGMLKARLAGLGSASVLINQDVDVDLVLQNVVDSSRSLTNASFGAAVIFDGSLGGKIMTSGFDVVGEEQWSEEMPQALALLSHLNKIEEPVRLDDFSAVMSPVGLPKLLPSIQSFLAAPIRNRKDHLGNIYLGMSQGRAQFTLEDEELLVMFAAQAAIAIDNARRYENEHRAKADLDGLINATPVAVLAFDARTLELVTVNEEARRLFRGINTPSDLLKIIKFKRPDGSEIPLEELPFERARRSGENVRVDDVVIHFPDGPPVPTLCNATPVLAESGEVVSVVATLQDMTPVEDLEKQRAEFLGMVSHELRMPLASIKGSATALLGPSSPLDASEAEQFYRIIDQQADHMLGIIKNLLDLTRIEAGVLSVDARPTPVADMVEDARRAFVSGAYRNAIQIELAPNLPPVMADRRRISQVLANLLSNASKYSPGPSVIGVSASIDGFHVAVTVSDEGRGISRDQLPNLFKRYSRLSPEDQDWKGVGEGLGLAICKGIVETHGGRIWAESGGPGLGAQFTFTMPVAFESATEVEPETRRQAAGTGGRILAVDDDPQMLWMLRRVLSDAGYVPVSTTNPGDVESLIEAEKPRLILLDRMLPGTDGFEIMKRIVDITDAPVIFLSGRGGDQEIVRAFDLGAADYVLKPFSSMELLARIRSTLQKHATKERNDGPRRPYVHGDLVIDYTERRVTVGGRQAELSATEYKLLFELSIEAGRVLTHDQLLRRVWGIEHFGDPRLVRTSVKAVRRELGDDARKPTYIFTEPRVGYRMASPYQGVENHGGEPG